MHYSKTSSPDIFSEKTARVLEWEHKKARKKSSALSFRDIAEDLLVSSARINPHALRLAHQQEHRKRSARDAAQAGAR